MFNRPLHGQKLKLCAVVIDLCTMQCPAPEGYWMVPSIGLFLGQYSPHSELRSICFKQVLLVGVWISQDWSTHHSFLQLMKCIPGSFVKDHSLFLLFCCVASCILMQEICHLGKVLNKMPVVPNKADKALNGSVRGGFGVFGDGLQVIPAWPYPFQGDTMP